MSLDTDKIKKPKKKDTTKIVQGPDGMMYKVSPDGDMELIETTKRSIGPAGASTVSDDGKRMITRAKGGMVKKYMGGGEVHMDDSPNSGLITTKGFGASRAT